MDTTSLLYRLGLALAVGLLVGTERHWRERDEVSGSRTAGIRTFGISGMVGGLAAVAAQELDRSTAGPALFVALVFIAYTAAFGLFKWRETNEQHDFSVTTVIVGQATFLLGVLAIIGDSGAVAAAAIALTLLLASREGLHRFIAKLEWVELRAAILLLAMAFIVLPLLPDRFMGPFQAINPAELWIFVIALAGLSYVGYVAVKIFGATRGPLIAGVAGGLVSSTAVALNSARRSVQAGNTNAIAAGALAASAVSAARAIFIAFFLLPGMLPELVPVLGAVAALLIMLAMSIGLRARAEPTVPDSLGNPFSLGSILQLTAVIAVAMILVRFAAARSGGQGIIATSGLMGLVDIDAVMLSVAKIDPRAVPMRELEWSILAAVGANLVAKSLYSAILGSRRFAFIIAVASGLALAAGLSVAFLIFT